MGVVYLALRRADGSRVAVKTIVPGAAPLPGAVDRFLREASILGQLDHPHIVRFHEMGVAGGLLFFAMDYVPGTDAAKLLKRAGRLGVRPAVRLVSQLLSALEYAHSMGFVHRDVKPANVLLEGQGKHKVVKVADFGLARVYEASQLSGLTLANDVGGTVGYLPPEQITGYRDVRPAADQYSAAATLYHLLTGRYVYDLPGSVTEQLNRILNEDPVPIRTRVRDLPGGLARVVHRALAREPKERYPDVAAFRKALTPFGR
jgi:serine/threonine-protein kinase